MIVGMERGPALLNPEGKKQRIETVLKIICPPIVLPVTKPVAEAQLRRTVRQIGAATGAVNSAQFSGVPARRARNRSSEQTTNHRLLTRGNSSFERQPCAA